MTKIGDTPQGDPIEPVEALPGEQLESSLQDDPQDPPSGDKDPLDGIEDPAQLRNEAKKFRSIAQRHNKPQEKKPDEARPTPTPAAPLPADVVTKRDLARVNSQKAIKAAKAADAEVDENWDKILPFYRNTRGQEDPDLIVEDIKDAVTLWKARKPADKPADPTAHLQTSTQRAPSSRPAPKGEERKTKPLRQKSQSMKEWYPKKPE